MNRRTLTIFFAGLALAMAGLAIAQQATSTPTIEQLRRTMSRLRGNRIATPTDYDTLTPEQKKYVESILSGPRGDTPAPSASCS